MNEMTATTQPAEKAKTPEVKALKPLASVSWPPEPDESVFIDPLRKEDPKPLRREELLRIGKSCGR